jgi:hypothetical protein
MQTMMAGLGNDAGGNAPFLFKAIAAAISRDPRIISCSNLGNAQTSIHSESAGKRICSFAIDGRLSDYSLKLPVSSDFIRGVRHRQDTRWHGMIAPHN